MAFTGRLAEQARVIIRYGKKLPLVNIFAVTDGVITGFVDKNGNPDKASDIINNNGKIDTLII